jgi:uncharacterized protein YcbK (DUF882 family)
VGDLSPHFSRAEFDQHDGHGRSNPDPLLIHDLEELRSIVSHHVGHDAPLRIVSGFRTPAYNASVGGAPRSQHLYNRAADIPSGYATVSQAEAAGFTGIGHCGGWVVHVDVRPAARQIFTDC